MQERCIVFTIDLKGHFTVFSLTGKGSFDNPYTVVMLRPQAEASLCTQKSSARDIQKYAIIRLMRKQSARLLGYLLLNIIVSAVTTFIVVSLMLRGNLLPEGSATDMGASQPVTVGQPDMGGDVGGAPVVLGQLEITTVVGAGDIANERVLISHVGQDELSLAGWKLRDADGNTFTFPGLTMYSGGAVTVFSNVGPTSVVELHWGLEGPVWQEGELATLEDPDGNIQATYTVP